VLTAFVTSRHEFSGWPKNAEMKAAELNRRDNSANSPGIWLEPAA
jgi:hypothetical protein